MRSEIRSLVLASAGLAITAAVSFGATIVPGLYTLHNHPDGNVNPPPYGARFDELYNATSGHDVFTMDFDHPLSNMTLVYTGATITISGQSWGGRDIGAVHAVDQYLGVYTFNFVYHTGVGPAGADDDIWVNAANHVHTGTIMTPLGDTINLVDERDGGFSFRFGDEDNDLGHRGHNGISGWGWMSYVRDNGIVHNADTDWLFTAQFLIPAPGAGVLVMAGGLLAVRRRRQP